MSFTHVRGRSLSRLTVVANRINCTGTPLEDQVNLYEYVGDDPIDEGDFSGNSITELGFVIYDGAQAVSGVANGASTGEIINDAVNIGLDAAPVPGLREVKEAVEVGRAIEHGVEAVRAERAAARKVGSYRHTFESGTRGSRPSPPPNAQTTSRTAGTLHAKAIML